MANTCRLLAMYVWCLLPSLTSAGAIATGTSADLASAMKLTEPAVTSGLVFMIAIKEMTRRISVDELVPGYVPTGREWRARRDIADRARWSAHLVPVDPDAIYHLPLDRIPGAGPEEFTGAGRGAQAEEAEPAEGPVGSAGPASDAPR